MEEDLDLKQVIVLFNRDKSGRSWDSSWWKNEEDLGDIPMEEDLDLKQVIVLFNRDKSGRSWDSSWWKNRRRSWGYPDGRRSWFKTSDRVIQ
jgi:hypothetical protein